MIDFINSLVSMPVHNSDFKPILEIDNKNGITSFRIIVLNEDYFVDGTLAMIKRIFEYDAEVIDYMDDGEFYETYYKSCFVFRTQDEAPLFINEINNEDVQIERIRSIISGIKEGSFQIMLDFKSGNSIFINEDRLEEIKVGTQLTSNNLNFVKNIAVCFRFLSYDNNDKSFNLPALIGSVFNFGGKQMTRTKVYNGENLIKTFICGRDGLKDFFYSLLNGPMPRLDSFSGSDRMLLSSKEVASIISFVNGRDIYSKGYRVYDPGQFVKSIRKIEQSDKHVDFTKMGHFEHHDYKDIPFVLDDEQLRKHMLIIGATGTGKSTALKSLIIDDIKCGRGFTLFDPNGDLAMEVLDLIPEDRKDDVIYIDPTNPRGLVCLSLFGLFRQFNKHHEKNQKIFCGVTNTDNNFRTITNNDMLMHILTPILADISVGGVASMGPRLDSILKNVGTELLRYNLSQITDLLTYLNNKEFRKKIISNVPDKSIQEILMNFENPRFTDEYFQSARNKVQPFIGSVLKPIFSGEPKFDLRDATDSGKIFIFRLPKGGIGEGSSLIGKIMINMFWAAIQSRVDTPINDRKDFSIYVDEFQNLITEGSASILEEARKYRLRFIMATQYTKQVRDRSPHVFNSIIGTIGTFVSLGVGYEDAELFGKYFNISTDDMINLPPLHAYVKCSHSSESFNVRFDHAKKDDSKHYPGAEELIRLSHSKYGVDVTYEIKDKRFSIYKESILNFLLLLDDNKNTIIEEELRNKFNLKEIVSEQLMKALLRDGILKGEGNYMFDRDELIEIAENIEKDPQYVFDYKEEVITDKMDNVSSYCSYFNKLPSFETTPEHFMYEKKYQEPRVTQEYESYDIENEISIDEEFDNSKVAIDILNVERYAKDNDNVSLRDLMREFRVGYKKAKLMIDHLKEVGIMMND